MAKIDEILKKLKEIKENKERIRYLEGLLVVVKDKGLSKKIRELLNIVREEIEKQGKKEKIIEEILEPRRINLPEAELDIKYEPEQRREERIQPTGLETTVEKERTEAQERPRVPEYVIREKYAVEVQRPVLERITRGAREEEPRIPEMRRDVPIYFSELERQRRGQVRYEERAMETIEVARYMPTRRLPTINVRDFFEKDESEKYKRVNLIEAEEE